MQRVVYSRASSRCGLELIWSRMMTPKGWRNGEQRGGECCRGDVIHRPSPLLS